MPIVLKRCICVMGSTTASINSLICFSRPSCTCQVQTIHFMPLSWRTHASMHSRIKSKCEGSTSYILVSLGGLFVDLHGLTGGGKNNDETRQQVKQQVKPKDNGTSQQQVCRPKKKKRQHLKGEKRAGVLSGNTNKRQGRDEIRKIRIYPCNLHAWIILGR